MQDAEMHARWMTTLRVVPVHMGAGTKAARCWRVESASEPRPFYLIAPESAMTAGREYEVEMTVVRNAASGGIETAVADVIHEVVNVPDAEMKQMLRDMIDPDAVAAFVAQEKTR